MYMIIEYYKSIIGIWEIKLQNSIPLRKISMLDLLVNKTNQGKIHFLSTNFTLVQNAGRFN